MFLLLACSTTVPLVWDVDPMDSTPGVPDDSDPETLPTWPGIAVPGQWPGP